MSTIRITTLAATVAVAAAAVAFVPAGSAKDGRDVRVGRDVHAGFDGEVEAEP